MRWAGAYGPADTERRAVEPPKAAQAGAAFPRSPFERDRARVLHSYALRRLAAKTQVVEPGAADFPRTRLTHSLECAQIGRELGAALGCDPDLTDAACLAHDLGHPPFGHNGETALAEIAASCGGFEGNAQSLRLLTRLEAKIPGAGLNLTRATLDATLKYPWTIRPGGAPRQPGGTTPRNPPLGQPGGTTPRNPPLGQPGGTTPRNPALGQPGGTTPRNPALGQPGGTTPRNPAKYGAYDDDGEVFAWIRKDAPAGRPCLEAQVMDWADDVAYSVHDLEDGLHTGLITMRALHDPGHRAEVLRQTRELYCAPGSVAEAELAEVFAGLLALPCWPPDSGGGPGDLAGLKALTSELIGRFCGAAQQATLAAADGAGPFTRYATDLVVPRQQRLECALLKGVAMHFVMGREGAAEMQARQRELIAELATAIRAGAPATLDPALQPAFRAAGSDAARLRAVVDQVASLTDTSAIAWHRRLCG